jgi:hypothetical protein
MVLEEATMLGYRNKLVVRIYTLANPTQFGLSQGLLARILALRYEK